MLLVVGWDGACLEAVAGARAAGRMPVLEALLRSGRAWRVQSTLPPVTFPAWTSFLTGAAPDHHGITDFAVPRAGTYGVCFVNATHRRLPTMVGVLADAGLRVGLYGMPATYPPEGKGVFEVSGFDTPLGSGAGDRAVHPPGLAATLRARHGRLGIEGLPQARIGPGWHAAAREQLLDDVRLRVEIAVDLLRSHELDAMLVHFMEPDTASHHFHAFDDPRSPLHRDGPRGVVDDVYAELDRGLGRLLEAAGPGTRVMLLSDHGSAGASDRCIFWNRWLADAGFLAFESPGREPAALRWKRRALQLVPAGLQAAAFSALGGVADRLESAARYAGIDWTRTRVYCDEVPYFPSLRINLQGREPGGIVAPSVRDALVEEVQAALLAMRDPFDGLPVVQGVRRREELFDGPCAGQMADLLLELRCPDGYAYGAASSRGGLESHAIRRRSFEEVGGAKGASTPGVHSPEGMAVLACWDGTDAAAACVAATGSGLAGSLPACSLEDLGATVFALAGVERPAWVTGQSLLDEHHDARLPAVSRSAAAPSEGQPLGPGLPAAPVPREYAEDEAREVEERLRALGYLP